MAFLEITQMIQSTQEVLKRTLSGHGELEVAGGKKIQVGPGSINLVEDVTGKGHIARTVGNEDRVTIQIPVTDR
jgi:hypothetical protein